MTTKPPSLAAFLAWPLIGTVIGTCTALIVVALLLRRKGFERHPLRPIATPLAWGAGAILALAVLVAAVVVYPNYYPAGGDELPRVDIH